MSSVNEYNQYTIFPIMTFRHKHSDSFMVSWELADKVQVSDPGVEVFFNLLFWLNFIYHRSILLQDLKMFTYY